MDKMSDHLPIAHIRPDGNGGWIPHGLEDHLLGVAELARRNAAAFGAADWGYVAGLWHDLGKYRPGFQKYIRSKSGYDAHIENAPGRVDHSTAGAVHSVEQLGLSGRILAYLIAGHHAGLPDYASDETGGKSLITRLANAKELGYLPDALGAGVPENILKTDLPAWPPTGKKPGDLKAGFHLWVRMLFSCLVDADFLDTEAFMQPERPGVRRGFPCVQELLPVFDRYMARLAAKAAPTAVNRIRGEVLARCRSQATQPPGLFSLTVPTGGGKTLSSLAFALEHATAHDKRRVIYVIPYTSIIEQTADTFREAIAEMGEVLVEHHSNAESDPDKENHRTRLACENWDAPLIVTTNVQFLESLYAARTSRCRKLHNIANSVVIFDEAQMLPPELLQTVLNTLSQLKEHYGVSLVFCTATQPALNSRESLESRFQGLDEVREIMDDPKALHHDLKRVQVELPDDLHQQAAWKTLADELTEHESVLCIVNRRDDCRQLHELMAEDTFHLSALMCGQHRADRIGEIKDKLERKQPVRVISTQLVEAGVDLDFPVVYRALAGLDCIAQAAGRCNREGRLQGLGKVKVFVPPSKNFGLIARAEQAARELLHGFEGDLLEPDTFLRFFDHFYSRVDTDRKRLEEWLAVNPDTLGLYFRTAAAQFRLIDDEHTEAVFVNYGKGEGLIEQLRKEGPHRLLMRQLQRYSVSVPKYRLGQLVEDHCVEELPEYPGVYVQRHDGLYSNGVGLLSDAICPMPVCMI